MALKDVFGPMFESMLQGEMNGHLGYENNDKNNKETDNRRNDYITKNVKTSMGEMSGDYPGTRTVPLNQRLFQNEPRIFLILTKKFCLCMPRK